MTPDEIRAAYDAEAGKLVREYTDELRDIGAEAEKVMATVREANDTQKLSEVRKRLFGA